MALRPGQPEALLKRLKPARQRFGRDFRQLLGGELLEVDRRLRTDVEQMSAFRELAPLPDADRVVLRNRLLWLLADHSRIRGNITVPSTWTLVQTTDALRAFDGTDDRCPRPETEIKLLNALVEHYAEQVVLTRLGPAVTRWIEEVTADMLGALGLPKRETPAVRNLVKRQASTEMVRVLTEVGTLDTPPAEIRKSPFKTFQ